MSTAERDKLTNWPTDKPVGLIIRGTAEHPALRKYLLGALPADSAVQRWWLLDEENQYVAEPIAPEAPDFAWSALLKLRDPSAARRWLETLQEQAQPPCVYLAELPPGWARPILKLIQGTLNRLPLKLDPSSDIAIDPQWLGGVNPTPQADTYAGTLPQDESIGVLNLHSYKRIARDPFTGEEADGRTIASRYLKRGFLTFTRVGGRVSFTATCKGQLLGAPKPDWQIVGLIWYPSRRAFACMALDPRFVRAAAYRKVGLKAASVSHTRVVASSETQDIRP